MLECVLFCQPNCCAGEAVGLVSRIIVLVGRMVKLGSQGLGAQRNGFGRPNSGAGEPAAWWRPGAQRNVFA